VASTGLLYQTRIRINDECGTNGEMLGRGNWSTQRKPHPVSLCPPQILHDLTRARTRAAAVGRRRLTAWTMARPYLGLPCMHSTPHSSALHALPISSSLLWSFYSCLEKRTIYEASYYSISPNSYHFILRTSKYSTPPPTKRLCRHWPSDLVHRF
jgi:hypothetical protein